MTTDDFLPNRNSVGSIVRHLAFAPRDSFAGGNASKRFSGAFVRVGLRVILAGIGPTKAAHRHLAATDAILYPAFSPELWNNHLFRFGMVWG